MTEPNTGSNTDQMKAVAEKNGDYLVINGTKNLITLGRSRHRVLVALKMGELFNLLINSLLYAEREENKLGMRASDTS